MKKPLHLLITAFSALLLQEQSNAQATLISNNTYIISGFVLPSNNKPIMWDSKTDAGLWTTDGTTATKITTAVTHPDSTGAAYFNNLMYFTGSDATTHDAELWVTDGTAAGTKLIKNIASTGSSVPDNYFVFNNTLYFTANDGTHGRELWKSNGAVGNATLVADINAGIGNSIENDVAFYQNGNNVYFSATTGQDTGLYKLDQSGTPALVAKISGSIDLSLLGAASLGSKTVFTVRTGDVFLGNTQLWVTEGTAASTTMLYDFGIGSGYQFLQLIPYKNLIFFDGYDMTTGDVELWSTDGTKPNTKLFKDINPGDNPSIPLLYNSALINGKMFFTATTDKNGYELWVTDGTPGGTTLFKDINTTSSGAGDANPVFLANIGSYANQLTNNTGSSSFNFQQANSTPFNGKWYFTADDGSHGTELWSTDGTAANTKLVKDLNAGTADGTAENNIAFYTTTGIYFVGNNGASGEEPFVTDGTDAGTKLVADINTGSVKDSKPVYMFLYNSQIYLNADNGDNNNSEFDNPDLYKINQTVTVLPVKLLNFNVALHDGGVGVNWTTASEVNTKNFVVERSTDGIHFSALGTVGAAGNSSTAHQYQFTDANALQASASTLYYRLRIVDNDGRYSYTSILPVQLQGGVFRITLSPNPVRDQLTVAFSTNNSKTVTLRVNDANGKIVYKQQFQTNGVASMQQYINVSSYASGSYFVQLVTDKDTKTAKFVKQ